MADRWFFMAAGRGDALRQSLAMVGHYNRLTFFGENTHVDPSR